jgi:hypothetical protein
MYVVIYRGALRRRIRRLILRDFNNVRTAIRNGVGSACGAEAVEDLLRARSLYPGVTRLFALTNAARFTKAAAERAQTCGIKLVARDELEQWPRQLCD